MESPQTEPPLIPSPTESPHRRIFPWEPRYLYLSALGISIDLDSPGWSAGFESMTEAEHFAPNGSAPALPDLIFGTALTPQRSNSAAN